MSETFAQLKLDQDLHVVGEGQINTRITAMLAKAILALPRTGDLTFDSVITRMTKRCRSSFDNIVMGDEKLAASAAIKLKRVIAPEEIVEELYVALDPVGTLLFTKSGERFVAVKSGIESKGGSDLLTFAEFEMKYGRSVLEWIKQGTERKKELYDRASSILDGPLIEYTLNVVTKEMAVATKKITAYSADHVKTITERQGDSIMDTTTKVVEPPKKKRRPRGT